VFIYLWTYNKKQDSMQLENINGLPLWQFNLLKREQGIKHFVTGRKIDESPEAFTLSYSSTPDKERVKAYRNLLASSLNLPEERLFIPSQVHKDKIVQVRLSTPKEELLETDALITHEKGICIAVLVADCVPILVYDKKNNAVAAIHSGWKGTVAKILEKTLLQMCRAFGTKGEDVVACIGPSICQKSYEVGEEVASQFNDTFGPQSGLLIPKADNKAQLDLWKANKLQLLEFGVRDANIETAKLCTMTHNRHFFSARKGDSGRFAAGIMLG
jgi:polyphenol oxidase